MSSLHTLILPRHDMSTTRQQLAAIGITLVTLVTAGLVSNLEAALPRYVKQTAPVATVTASASPAVTELTAKVEILRNAISFFWVAGGAVLGAYVGVAIRKVTGRNNIAIHVSVALATSLAVTPYVLKNHVNGEPETCFMGGFLMAVAAWVIWEIVVIIGNRLKKAAEDRGWFGVKQELFGATTAQVTTQTTVPQVPAAKPQSKG